jgi:hypothetical protein
VLQLKQKKDDDFQTIFAYCEYNMREHINQTIGKKDAERKARHTANGERKEPKGLQLGK